MHGICHKKLYCLRLYKIVIRMFENQRNNVSKHQQLYLQTHTFPYIQVRCYYLHDHHFYIRRHFIRCISLQLCN